MPPPSMGYGVLLRMRPAASCHQNKPRHVFMCNTSAYVAGVVWHGREAIRYGQLPTGRGNPTLVPHLAWVTGPCHACTYRTYA